MGDLGKKANKGFNDTSKRVGSNIGAGPGGFLQGVGFGPNSYWDRRGRLAGQINDHPEDLGANMSRWDVNGFQKADRGRRNARHAAERDAHGQALLARQRAMSAGLGGGGSQVSAEFDAHNSVLAAYAAQRAQMQQQKQQQNQQGLATLMSLIALL